MHNKIADILKTFTDDMIDISLDLTIDDIFSYMRATDQKVERMIERISDAFFVDDRGFDKKAFLETVYKCDGWEDF